MSRFIVARNPDPDSSLPFLVRLPLEGGILLKTRESWPRANRSYCHPLDVWPDQAEIVEEVPVKMCRRRGSAIDLILDRGSNYRSQFVFVESRGREMIFWQTAKVTRKARPGSRVPKRRASGITDWTVFVDTRERYPYRFADRPVVTERRALPAVDYGVFDGDRLVASVERKTLENLQADLVSGKLGFVMAELSTLEAAAVVVEDRYTSLFRSNMSSPAGSPNLWRGCRCATPVSRSSFATTASSPRSGPTASSVLPSPNWEAPSEPSVVRK